MGGDFFKKSLGRSMKQHAMMMRMHLGVFIIWATFLLVAIVAESVDECVMQPDGTCVPPTNDWTPVRVEEDDSHYLEIPALGMRQSVENGYTKAIEKRIQKVVEYMKGLTAPECQFRNELCAYWAVLDECDKNPGTILARGSISSPFETPSHTSNSSVSLQATCK
jgi:hypothetical protein